MKRRITEMLDVDLDREKWCCNRCGAELASARESYKRGTLVHDRDPRTLYPPSDQGDPPLAPDPAWCRFVEFYCPRCGVMLEVEVLPPGHPLTWDLELDLDALKTSSRENP